MSTAAKTDVREKLLETAARLFYSQGYKDTGINQIIDEASVCKASFYNHFKTKEDLLIAYLERSHDQSMAALRQRLAQVSSPREQLRELFRCQAEKLEKSGFRGCPFMNTLAEVPGAEDKVRQVIGWHMSGQRQILEEIVSRVSRERGLGAQSSRLADDLEVVMTGGLMAARAQGNVAMLRHAQSMAERMLGLDES